MAKVNIKVKGADKLIKKIQKLGEQAEFLVDAETHDSANQIVLDAERNVSNKGEDTGRLRGSITSQKLKDASYVVYTNVDYAPYVEFGTGAKVSVPAELSGLAAQFKGKGKGSFKDGLDNIKAWCKRKGIPETAAYPIFIKILREGSEPRPFMYPAFIKERPEYIKKLKKLLKKLSK